LLKRLEAPAENVAAQAAPAKCAVYLAESSYDRREERHALEADLQFHGYAILPDRQLPREEADYVAEVARLLEKCKLSIHLVGSGYGAVPDGPSQKSVVVLQNDLAVQRCRNGALQRVIWLPEGTASQQGVQREFIEALQKDAEAQFGADLVTADLESLKGAVHAVLRKLEEPERPKLAPPGPANATKLVYLICDERDRSATIPLRKYLRSQGLDFKIPLFEGDAATVRQANQDLLTQCDSVMLFYGAGDEAWKRTVENDLKKVRGYRTERTLSPIWTYLALPATTDKSDLIELEEPNLIDGLKDFPDASLKAYVETLRRA
jgi:hypothetical protein